MLLTYRPKLSNDRKAIWRYVYSQQVFKASKQSHIARLYYSISRSAMIRRVTIAGINGAIGSSIMNTLVSRGFEIQVISRTGSQVKDVAFRAVDYNNHEELVSILQGQDAVVSCLGDTSSAVNAQLNLIEASISAGVRRFIPSEFGADTSHPYVRNLPFFWPKIRHQQVLREATARRKDFSYTILITGLLLDWCLHVVPCIIDVGSRTAQVYDGGNIPFSVSRISAVADAVASILEKPTQTRNRILRMHELITSQNELIRRASSFSVSARGFQITSINTSTYEDAAWKAYCSSISNPLDWKVPFINLSIWSQAQPGRFLTVDNQLVGIKELSHGLREAAIDHELHAAFLKFAVSERCKDLSMVDLQSHSSTSAYKAGKTRLIE